MIEFAKYYSLAAQSLLEPNKSVAHSFKIPGTTLNHDEFQLRVDDGLAWIGPDDVN